eukprot:scaffold97558_cov23-Cyclotella_meneghiniana.AAC.1
MLKHGTRAPHSLISTAIAGDLQCLSFPPYCHALSYLSQSVAFNGVLLIRGGDRRWLYAFDVDIEITLPSYHCPFTGVAEVNLYPQQVPSAWPLNCHPLDARSCLWLNPSIQVQMIAITLGHRFQQYSNDIVQALTTTTQTYGHGTNTKIPSSIIRSLQVQKHRIGYPPTSIESFAPHKIPSPATSNYSKLSSSFVELVNLDNSKAKWPPLQTLHLYCAIKS